MTIPYIPGVPKKLIDLTNKRLDAEYKDALQAIVKVIDASERRKVARKKKAVVRGKGRK